MIFRKLVNHITHSKSATSWTAEQEEVRQVRVVEREEPIRDPAPCSGTVAVGVYPHSEGGVQEEGMDEGPKGQACSSKLCLPCTQLAPDILLPHPCHHRLVLEGRNQRANLS